MRTQMSFYSADPSLALSGGYAGDAGFSAAVSWAAPTPCRVLLILGVLLLGGCGEETPPPEAASPPPPATTSPVVQRTPDFAQIARGAELFAQHCAQCHGTRAEGDPDWRRRGPDGRFPPPPLDETGHAWHHPLAQLRHMIKSGGPPGQSNMPAFGDTLKDRQINDIIAWFQSLWPDEIYQAWYQVDQRTRPRMMRQ